MLKRNVKTQNIHAFCIFSRYGLKIGGHVNSKFAKIPPDEVYMLGW